jgi:hypothetical protein
MPCGDCPGHFFMARHEKPVRAVYYICTFMMKKLLSAVLLFATLFSFGQANSLFKGYFSFNSIKDLSQTDTALYAAAENALFTDNLATSTITTTTTIDGLSGQTITAVYHSPTLNRTIIGYANGLIIVVNADGADQAREPFHGVWRHRVRFLRFRDCAIQFADASFRRHVFHRR